MRWRKNASGQGGNLGQLPLFSSDAMPKRRVYEHPARLCASHVRHVLGPRIVGLTWHRDASAQKLELATSIVGKRDLLRRRLG